MKICTIVGARPQFIKAAVVSRAIKDGNHSTIDSAAVINEVIIHTGQHYDANMSDIFFAELNIPLPDYHLGIGGGSHGQNTGRMIEAIERVLVKEQPDWVLVYGDTDSTLAGAIAAVKLNIPIAHVESGLRSFNRRMPEEINRVLTDHVSTLLFTPTETATLNLAREGIAGEKVKQVGDVMYDAVLFYAEKAESIPSILKKTAIQAKQYNLITIHRAENTDDKTRLSAILDGLRLAGSLMIWPVHPRTKERIKEFKLTIPSNIQFIDPVGYLDMVMLEKSARLIITDSGGVQKEAYFHRVPCLTIREETEWIETVESGWNRLVNASPELIAKTLQDTFNAIDQVTSLYGDGSAGKKIVRELTSEKNNLDEMG
jgi:UDP-GlcNAc3NAcA epimerase